MTCYLPLPVDRRFSVPPNSVPLLEGSRPSLWDAGELIQSYVDSLRRFDFDPAVDYIVMTGKAAYLSFLSIAVWQYMDKYYPDDSGVVFLVYNAPTGDYKEVRIPRCKL